MPNNQPYIQFFGGIRGIGGNQILVMASNGKGVLLDFGLDMGFQKQYFDEFLKIRDKQILLDGTKIGLIPYPIEGLQGIYRQDLCKFNQEWTKTAFQRFKEQTKSTATLDLDAKPLVNEVLVSHAHLDHVGMIKHLHPSIKLVCSQITKTILERIDETGGSSSAFKGIIEYREIGLRNEPEEGEKVGSRVGTKLIPVTKRLFTIIKSGETISCADGGLKVTFVETDHSIPGAGAFIIEDIKTKHKIIYTGDIRMHGPNKTNAIKFFETAKEIAPNVYITEGTHLTPDPKPDVEKGYVNDRKNELPDEAAVKAVVLKMLQRIKKEDPNKAVFFDCSNRDLWRIGSFFDSAEKVGRFLVVDAKIYDLLKHLDPAGTQFGVKLDKLKVYLPRKDWGVYEYSDYDSSPAILEVFSKEVDLAEFNTKREEEHKNLFQKKKDDWDNGTSTLKNKPSYKPLQTLKEVPAADKFCAVQTFRVDAMDIHEHPGQYLLYLSAFTINELFDISPKPGSYYIQSKSGPFDDEGLLDEERRDHWLELFEIGQDAEHFGHFHCSGHIHQEELIKTILDIKPKQVFLVHSEGKQEFAKQLKGKVDAIVPELNKKYDW